MDTCLSPLECLARFISLPAVAPANDVPLVGTALFTALLSTEIAAEMATALGCDAAQEIVTRVLTLSYEVLLFVTDRPVLTIPIDFARCVFTSHNFTFQDIAQNQNLTKKETSLSKTEMAVAVALAAASISALVKSDSEKERRRLKSLLADYIQYRMEALEEKVRP